MADHAHARTRTAAFAALIMLAAFGVTAVLALRSAPNPPGFDITVARRLHTYPLAHRQLGDALRVIATLTLPWVLRGIALVAAVILGLRGRRRAALWLIVTMTAGGLLELGLKSVFARDRPVWPVPITTISGYSFPSGHALTSMLLVACGLVLLGPGRPSARSRRIGLWAAAIGFVLLVGFDRIGLGVHYLSDVLAGWTIALATVFTAVAIAPPPQPSDADQASSPSSSSRSSSPIKST
jgi:membrane-associated phospholipid phosphatase